MKDLLYKEFKLAIHPTAFLFLSLAAMLLIPSYPYYVAFIYTDLAVFFIFLLGRENQDALFSVSLPVRKRDTVKARCYVIVLIELAQIILSIPFAIIGSRINPNPLGNLAGIEANVAFFGFVFIMYALFNGIYLPMFYKSAYKAGMPLVFASAAIAVYIAAMEVAVQSIPFLKTYLDTWEPEMLIRQIPILVVGIGIYAVCMWLTYRKAAKNFESVDL